MTNKGIASADDMALVRKYMPKKGGKKEQELKDMLNTATRAGAGGTKAGLVGIRPQGLKKANEIVDFFTPGKVKMPDRPFEKPLDNPTDGKRAETPFTLVIMLPRNYCPDCDRSNRPAGDNAGGAVNVSFWSEERVDLGVKAMDSMISFFCQECCLKFQADIKDPGKDIQLATVHGIRQRRQQEQAERLVKVRKNTENYIRAMRMANRWEIYLDGRKD